MGESIRITKNVDHQHRVGHSKTLPPILEKSQPILQTKEVVVAMISSDFTGVEKQNHLVIFNSVALMKLILWKTHKPYSIITH